MAIHEFVTLADVQVLRPDIDPARGAALVVAANAQAVVAAPVIAGVEFLADEAKAESLRHILRSAVLRWDDLADGTAAYSTTTRQAGPMSETNTMDARQPGGFNLWPSEIDRIRELTSAGNAGGAFMISTTPTAVYGTHRDVCSINFGSAYCSCGAILTGWLHPLYEESV